MKIRILAVALLAGLWAGATQAADDVAILEGHVFSKWTGVPLHHAVVTAAIQTGPAGPLSHVSDNSDANGFYSIRVPTSHVVASLSARCDVEQKKQQIQLVVSVLHVPDPWLGVARRDAYLAVPKKKSFSACLHYLMFHDPMDPVVLP